MPSCHRLFGGTWEQGKRQERGSPVYSSILGLRKVDNAMSNETTGTSQRTLRSRYPMPSFIAQALQAHGLTAAYNARPPYQRNDYIGWITRAKRLDTQTKRLAQMLDELGAGDAYMRMPYHTAPDTRR